MRTTESSTPTPTIFALPHPVRAKAEPALIASDERHFATMASALRTQLDDLARQLARRRAEPGRSGQAALERDAEIHRLTARQRTLRRHGLDLCLGRMDPESGSAVYVGRVGLTGPDGERVLIDWRAPAAEPFFAATHADPMGLAARRRYRWTSGRITDYWDEVFSGETDERAGLEAHAAFLAGLGRSRTARMRDVLATLAAEQDRIIRADSSGPLMVDGGPGTGKTVVALHRAAYLLYADPQVDDRRGGVLVVGPHEPYLAYTADVLPSLGEEGVRTCTLADMVPEGGAARPEADPDVARLKASTAMIDVVEAAVRFYEDPPSSTAMVATPWGEVRIGRREWAHVFASVEPGTAHNEAHESIWEALSEMVAERLDLDAEIDDDGRLAEVDPRELTRLLRHEPELVDALGAAWPLVAPTDLVGDLWSVPAFLRHCAPHLSPEQVRLLQRSDPRAWTTADLPLLDAARRRLGRVRAARRRARESAEAAARAERMDDVVADLIAADDGDLGLMRMLSGDDLRAALASPAEGARGTGAEMYAGPFAHIVVDEAQELTEAQWRMLIARCPSGSMTIVGDRAQAREGFTESWERRLRRVGLPEPRVETLTINYRTPAPVMDRASTEIRTVAPGTQVPTSIRDGAPVLDGAVADLDRIVAEWLAGHDGIACVIGAPELADSARVRSLSPQLAKGLEFDLVVLVHPDGFGDDVTGAVDRYVAMTRATNRLAILT